MAISERMVEREEKRREAMNLNEVRRHEGWRKGTTRYLITRVPRPYVGSSSTVCHSNKNGSKQQQSKFQAQAGEQKERGR